MPGKHQASLQKTPVVLTLAAVVLIGIIYGIRHLSRRSEAASRP